MPADGLRIDVSLDGGGEGVRGGGDPELGPLLRRNPSHGPLGLNVGTPPPMLHHGSIRVPRRETGRRSSVTVLCEPTDDDEDDDEGFFGHRGKGVKTPSPSKAMMADSRSPSRAKAWMTAGGDASTGSFRTRRRSSDGGLSSDSGGHDDHLLTSPTSNMFRMGASSQKLVQDVVEQKSITSAKKIDLLRSTLAYVHGRSMSLGHDNLLRRQMSGGLSTFNSEQPPRKLTMIPPTEGGSKSLSRREAVARLSRHAVRPHAHPSGRGCGACTHKSNILPLSWSYAADAALILAVPNHPIRSVAREPSS